MKPITKPLILLVALATTLFMVGCEEALTDSNTNLVPSIPQNDGFVEFSSADAPTGTAGGTVELTVEPGSAVGEPITVEYSASGPALGSINPQSSIEIPYDTSTTELDDATITIVLSQSAALGDSLTVELTDATTASGQSLLVGRGGSDVDKSRTITVVSP